MNHSSRSQWLRWGAPALLVLMAGGASWYPQLFQLDRAELAAGQFWRLWTGHLVHGSWEHFAYDVLVAVLLGYVFGGLQRLLIWAPILSVALLLGLPQLEVYFGLSGLLHGWLVFEAGSLARPERGWLALLAGCLAAGTLVKAALETALGHSFFTGGMDLGGEVVQASHWIGALLGLSLLFADDCARRARSDLELVLRGRRVRESGRPSIEDWI